MIAPGAFEAAQEVIRNEGLLHWAQFTRPAGEANRIHLWQDADGWHISVTDERAVVVADTAYSTEKDALKEFIEDLRRTKRLSERGYY